MLGINDMQQAWQNFGGTNPGSNMSMGMSSFAGLQTPSAVTNTQNAMSGQANLPGINSIEMPSWLSSSRGGGGDISELTDTYGKIGAAFDPTGQVNARNAAIGYNTSAGTQAANNAASEYSARAAQSGGSSLGAGAVKAQAMMPVFGQNAALKIDAADTAAKSHQQGITLAGQIAGTIGQLRQSYLSTLTGYAQGQQQLALSKYQAEQSAAGNAGQLAYNYAALQSDAYFKQQALAQQNKSQAGAGGGAKPAGPLSNYSVRPNTGDGMHLAGFAPSMMAANQMEGSLYRRQAGAALGGMI